MKKKDLKIILVIIWMVTVFAFSAQEGTESSNTSGSFTMLIINILTGGNSNLLEKTTINVLEAIIRKLAHYSIYAVGGFLIMNCAYSTKQNNKKKIIDSILFGGCYACTDELHQFFVEGRSARIFDVGIDTLGVITGVLIYIAISEIIKKHKINR